MSYANFATFKDVFASYLSNDALKIQVKIKMKLAEEELIISTKRLDVEGMGGMGGGMGGMGGGGGRPRSPSPSPGGPSPRRSRSRSPRRSRSRSPRRSHSRSRDNSSHGGGGYGGSGYGGENGGGYACFGAGTSVEMVDGTSKAIEDVTIGDATRGGAVTGVMQFKRPHLMYKLNGTEVTGGHNVFDSSDGIWKPVKEVASAVRMPRSVNAGPVYDFSCTEHRIFSGGYEYTDYEEHNEIPEITQIELALLNSNGCR